MRKIICIVLMCWLPLFMGAANAMSMQMALGSLQNSAETTCPYMADMKMSEMAGMKMADMSKMTKSSEHKSSHHSTCAACAIASASASYNAMPIFNVVASANDLPRAVNVTFPSQDLPPAIKPPILN
jgi:hypothetical protein